MKRELESIIMDQLKKGYCPAYAGEEGYILISMKGYLAAAEYAGAEDPCFWYDDLFYDMIDVESGEDEIEAEDFDFMPRGIKEDFEEISPEEIESNICPTPDAALIPLSGLEDAEAMYKVINDRVRLLATLLYELRCDRVLKPELRKIDDSIQDIVADMERYEKMLSRIIAYIRAKKLGGEE